MPPKSSEKDSKNKKEKSDAIRRILTKDMNIIETTYEKVLSIINNVKEFLKKHAKHSQKMVEELEWVIKVISNKSLYSYELKQNKLHRQNSEFNKFINFVQKYNDEILEMNKRHILVTGLLNLVKKKGEMLNKPSLCLKRILPEELKNMDYKKEKEKRNRKKNFIALLGNAILNLYYKNKDKFSAKVSTDHLEEKEEKTKAETNENKEKEKEKEKKNNLEIDHNKDSNNFENVIIQNYTANSFKKNNELNTEGNKKRMTSSNKNKKNRKKKIIDEKNKRNIDSRNNLQNFITNYQPNNSVGKRKTNIIKLTKKEQPNLNSIKNAMENYYTKYTLVEHNGNHNTTKSNANKNKNFYKTNINLSNKSTYFERGALAYISMQNDAFPYRNKKNKNENHQTLILKNNNDSLLFKKKILKGNNFFEPIEQYSKSNKSYIEKKSKRIFSKRQKLNDNKAQNQKQIKNKVKDQEKDEKENDNNKNEQSENNNDKDKDKDKDKVKDKVKEEKIPLNVLIDKYFDDMKMITDKDFDIFEFKEKVGYINVLPLMCHCILKTLGLLDNRIITVTKVESFLNSVNENYKETTLYHNSLHGADVTQSLCVYFLNSNAEEICESNVLDLLGIIVSAMGHDLGHPGLTNNFHINASTDLAITYNDSSCLENFHTSFLFKIIRKEENNIFDKLTTDNYKSIRKRMISQILATDMANHGEVMSLIRAKVKTFQEQEGENEGEEKFNLLSGNEKTKFEEQQVLLNYLMHSADLGHNCKKYEISKKWVHLLCEEFWIQGDQEKKLGIPVSFLCDRDKIDVPASQVNFLRGFIISSFDCLVSIFPNLKYTMENAKNNIKEWQQLLDEHRVTGWTPQNEINNEEEKKE